MYELLYRPRLIYLVVSIMWDSRHCIRTLTVPHARCLMHGRRKKNSSVCLMKASGKDDGLDCVLKALPIYADYGLVLDGME